MFHPEKAGVDRQLKTLARSAGTFDARRYFRGPVDLEFYNTGTKPMRLLARDIYQQHRSEWTVTDAVEFADALMRDRHLETKGVAIEVLARFRRQFTPRLLSVCRRWLATGLSSNWATTDALCGYVIGPLLVQHPESAAQLRGWAAHRSPWVRRASVVALIPLVRSGAALDLLYDNAAALHGDREDLIQKAVGWALREAGKTDPRRLEAYLRANGPSIPRTTMRYAIERFAEPKRRALLMATKGL